MAKTPFPHQQAGADFIVERKGGAALWFAPRCGKTLTTITAIKQSNIPDLRLLVLCPKTVMGVWFDELAEQGIKAVICDGTATKKQKIMDTEDVVIVSYNSAWRLGANAIAWDFVIMDESLKLANWNAKQTKHWFDHCADKVILLSGAPCPESLLQIASQMIICRGSWFNCKNIWDYLEKYWYYDKEHHKWVCPFPGHLTEATDRMNVVGRSLRREDIGLQDIKFFRFLRIQADKGQLAEAKIINASDREGTHKAMYLQIAGSGYNAEGERISSNKVDAIAEYIAEKTEVEADYRVVIMCKYTKELQDMAEKLGVPYIDGSVTGKDREKIIKDFQSGKNKHIVCQVTVAKMGIDLSMARTIIYASNSWSGDDRIQSQERCTNLNKHDPVEIIDVVIEGEGFGIDYAIAESIKSKQDFNARTLYGYRSNILTIVPSLTAT